MKTTWITMALVLSSGCAELAPAKEPAAELMYAGELLCAQDLGAIPEVQQLAGAGELINEVCATVEAAKPYADLLLRQTRSVDPRAQARANALAILRVRAMLRGRK